MRRLSWPAMLQHKQSSPGLFGDLVHDGRAASGAVPHSRYDAIVGGDNRFWLLFGGIWLIVGVSFLAASLGVKLFADPRTLNQDVPLLLFFLVGFVSSGAGSIIMYFAHAAARDRRLMRSGIQLNG